MKRNNLFLILFSALALLLLLIFVLVLTTFRSSKNSSPNEVPTPTPIEANIKSSFPSQLKYSSSGKDKVEKMIQQNIPLQPDDNNLKQQLINSLGPNTTLLNVDDSFTVDYIQPFDEFLIQITKPDITSSKEDAISWFRIVGFSTDAICKLHIVFYLSPEIAQDVKNSGKEFDPSVPHCSY